MMETDYGGFSRGTVDVVLLVVLGVVLTVFLALINVIIYRSWRGPNVAWGVGKPRSKLLRRGNQGDSQRPAA